MKKILLVIACFLCITASAQFPQIGETPDLRCVSPKPEFGDPDVLWPSSYEVGDVKTLQYSIPRRNVDGIRQSLLMNIYYPPDGVTKKNLLWFWIHGGGYRGGSMYSEDIVYVASLIANMGGVGITLEYRTGWVSCDGVTARFCWNPEDSNRFAQAVLLAESDIRRAIRFAYNNRTTLDLVDEFDSVFVGGTSAGGSLSQIILTNSPQSFIDSFGIKGGYIGFGGSGSTEYFSEKRWLRGTRLSFTKNIQSAASNLALYLSHNNGDTIAPWTNGNLYNCPGLLNNLGGRLLYDSLRDDGSTSVALLSVCGRGHGLNLAPGNPLQQFDSLFNSPRIGIMPFVSAVNAGTWTNKRYTFPTQSTFTGGGNPTINGTCPDVPGCSFCSEP